MEEGLVEVGNDRQPSESVLPVWIIGRAETGIPVLLNGSHKSANGLGGMNHEEAFCAVGAAASRYIVCVDESDGCGDEPSGFVDHLVVKKRDVELRRGAHVVSSLKWLLDVPF